jgi:ubiquinone/menaquinone biosynthesis C-methylase UbiE
MKPRDHFSTQSALYLKYRPQYPPALYNFLSSLLQERTMAWDCGTGNGQCALSLTEYIDHVLATDLSLNQIQQAQPHPAIEYKVLPSEQLQGYDSKFDLITCANAMHWFNLDAFYATVRRVLKPQGVLAAWCYGVPFVSDEIQPAIHFLHDEVLGSFWEEANHLVEQEYKTLYFPFQEIEAPAFYSERTFNRADFIRYFHTWSATQKYIQQHGVNLVDAWEPTIHPLWPDADEEKIIRWKLILKVGRLARV